VFFPTENIINVKAENGCAGGREDGCSLQG
jgi:hypothetical protein